MNQQSRNILILLASLALGATVMSAISDMSLPREEWQGVTTPILRMELAESSQDNYLLLEGPGCINDKCRTAMRIVTTVDCVFIVAYAGILGLALMPGRMTRMARVILAAPFVLTVMAASSDFAENAAIFRASYDASFLVAPYGWWKWRLFFAAVALTGVGALLSLPAQLTTAAAWCFTGVISMLLGAAGLFASLTRYPALLEMAVKASGLPLVSRSLVLFAVARWRPKDMVWPGDLSKLKSKIQHAGKGPRGRPSRS